MDNETINEENMEIDEKITKRCRLPRRQTVQSKKICAKDERNASIKKVSIILQKSEDDRTIEETQVLTECTEAVEEVQMRWRRRDEAKRRIEEFEDEPDILQKKCYKLAQAIAQSQHLVVYTGAGISTAAKIPDYRGPNGIWTRLQQGKEIGDHDLSLAEPTYTHMALYELYRQKILKYVVSQNCDGLHLRSGLPRTALSELHGNMYIEVCKSCKPHKEYWRLFDVTENTARYAHKTTRKCYTCNEPLVDTIVHFGERGSLSWPLNWSGACRNAEKATTILCIGSSLKVLKKYPRLWQMDKPVKKRPNLYIINLQWTPKDDCANIKINGKCDKIMEILMNTLGIQVPSYDKMKDPIFVHSTKLCKLEYHTTTQPPLKYLDEEEEEEDDDDDDDDDMDQDDSKVQNKIINNKLDNNKDCCSFNSNVNSSIDLNIKKSDYCDNNSNNSNNLLSETHCLPVNNDKVNNINTAAITTTTSNNYNFSIDNILHKNDNKLITTTTTTTTTQPTPLNLFSSAFLTYNLLQHQIFGPYTDFLYYPYQTSFLYPGLHSIINPIQYNTIFDYTSNNKSINNQLINRNNSEIVKIEEPSCEFCDKNYNSVGCLFYKSTQPVFINQQYRFSKLEQKRKPNICVCCDYTTDEDDLDMTDDNNEKDQLKINKIQAGWFGKGYKKNRRPKKRNTY